MANDKFIGNSVNGAERRASRLPASAGSGTAGSIVQPRESIVGLFEGVAAANRDKVAAVCGNTSLTYDALNSRANHVAERLRGLGVRGDSFVAIYLDRSLEMLVAMLGILKAGGAYLPIDSMYPSTRVLEMLEDAKPVAILTTASLSAGLWEQISELSVTALNMEELLADAPADVPDSPVAAGGDDLAYMIYTSGSTGKPKGVMVTHRNVVRLLSQTEPWFHFDARDVWTMFHSIAFDFSVWEIWGCLLTGGRLVIVPFVVSRSPMDFYDLLSSEKVTVLNQTPSAFSILVQVEENTAPLPLYLRYVIFGGEALQYRKLAPWFQRHGDTNPQLINMYGITETTVHVTYRAIKAEEAETVQESLIGVPIPDLQLHLLDASGEPVAEGEVGEIYVGGAGVSRGYHNRPQLNRERFLPDTFASSAGARLYRTGDLARVRTDGEMVYLGRNDSQVKINGFRIELGEVEAVMASAPGVKQSCVVARPDGDGSQRLAAYFVAAPGNDVTANSLGKFFSEKMPAHMRPSSYTRVDELPLTVNGKLDASALPVPTMGGVAGGSENEPAQSLSSTEETVARIFSEVLGLRRIGLDDNFFDCGGTSLLLIKAHLRVQAEFEKPIPVILMFECPTVRSLAARLSVDRPSLAAMNAVQQQARKARDMFARARAAKGVAS
jgi:amino acid adenylation domain-containing protein